MDNGYTPYVSVVVDAATRVPLEYVRNGEIVLNIGPLAANRLKMGNESIEFSARFGGVAAGPLDPGRRRWRRSTRARTATACRSRSTARKTAWEASGRGGCRRKVRAAPEPPAPAPGGGKPNLRVIK